MRPAEEKKAEEEKKDRVLVLAPTQRDASLCRRILEEAGLDCVTCPDVPSLCQELRSGAEALLLPEEVVRASEVGGLVELLEAQPSWSEIPVLILAPQGNTSPFAASTFEGLGNVTVIERPVRLSGLMSALRSALKARRRQYQIRDYIEEQIRAERALKEADQRKDEFLAMLAHELRNPLAPILNAAEVLKTHGTSPSMVERVQAIIERQTRHMARLVDDLLDVSRITQGKVELRKERVDLAAVISQAVQAVRPTIEARDQDLSVFVPMEPVTIEADPARLQQVVANLLTNASKYNKHGGKIILTAGRADDEAFIRVNDTGLGISPDLLPHVFDLFFQADHSLDRSQGGLGLGLTLVHRLVEQHGGSVRASSPGIGHGSEFEIRLPPCEPVLEEKRTGETEGGGPHAPAPSLQILVVDDNQDAADLLSEMLSMLGHHVRTAYEGLTALEIARDQSPQVVLLDIGLPGLDGLAVARSLRQRGMKGTLIATSGYGQEEDRAKTRAAGFDHHLVKPIVFDSLLELIAEPP
ncbi:MAG: response regulator [Armatimonadetes bacterium]|nr:response regulator [Armatimonadota bacterium]